MIFLINVLNLSVIHIVVRAFYDNSWMSACDAHFASTTPTTASRSIKAKGEKLDLYLDKIETDRQNAYQELFI